MAGAHEGVRGHAERTAFAELRGARALCNDSRQRDGTDPYERFTCREPPSAFLSGYPNSDKRWDWSMDDAWQEEVKQTLLKAELDAATAEPPAKKAKTTE